jgi:hypothetical protein
MICCYHYLLFSDFVDDVEIRYKIGYSLIGFTLLCTGLSIALTVGDTLR